MKSLVYLMRNTRIATKCHGPKLIKTYSSDASGQRSSFCQRSHHCGELTADHVGQSVRLCGWVQHQRMDKFLTIRDSYGVTQVLLDQAQAGLADVPAESVVAVEGTVQPRPQGQENPAMPTGSVEVAASHVQLLNEARPDLPFAIHDFHKVRENLRLEYRYLDLRNKDMQRNLRQRSQVIMKMREYLCNMQSFVEVETPTLFRRTPGGAREFPVATHFPGLYYSLPQSPQQFKQLLMVGGLDRYMQVARCYRDETARPDRQPEFTQLDLEMSFVSAHDVQAIVEGLLHHCWPSKRPAPPTEFPRLTYQEAMAQYGSDKPDTRFDMKLCDVSAIVEQCSLPRLADHARGAPETAAMAVNANQAGKTLSRKEIDELRREAKSLYPDLWFAAVKVAEDGSWQGSLEKNMGVTACAGVREQCHLAPGDLLLLAAGPRQQVCELLGQFRVSVADRMEAQGVSVRSSEDAFLWVEEFPLFVPREDGSPGLQSAHHPFTAPWPGEEKMVYEEPLKVRGQHYDLVLNGHEIGGGSIRIHEASLQRYVLDTILQEDSSSLHHLLEALDSGCPPHGGIALGLDRLLAILCQTNSIRDVIAFPKSSDGRDPMTKAPAPLSEQDKIYYHQ